MASPPPILSIRDLGLRFGGLIALQSVSFDIPNGSISALIGPNGAGKTTVFNCVTGFYKASSGTIQLRSGDRVVDIGRLLGGHLRLRDVMKPGTLAAQIRYKMLGGSHAVAKAGIARTFQNIRLFREMTCVENLLVAQHFVLNRSLVSGVLATGAYKAAEQRAIANAFHWLRVVGMADTANRLAGELPYGLQRRLEIARAMAANPSLICLDEPAAGLNPSETAELSVLIRRIREEFNATVLLVEHDMRLVMGICDHIVVLDRGRVIADGPPYEIRRSPAVLSAYLGTHGTAKDEASGA